MTITVEHERSDLEGHGIGDKTINIIFRRLDISPAFEYLIKESMSN